MDFTNSGASSPTIGPLVRLADANAFVCLSQNPAHPTAAVSSSNNGATVRFAGTTWKSIVESASDANKTSITADQTSRPAGLYFYLENVSALLRPDAPSAAACEIEPGRGGGSGADAG